MAKRTKPSTDSDQPWKEILTTFLEDAILFIEPSLHAMIDWSRGVEFLEQELHEITKTRFHGAKLCDKLVKLWTTIGKPLFLFVHVEIESNPKPGFPLRFYHYRILIFDKHKSEDIYSIAIYTGNPSKNQVDKYEFNLLRNKVLFEFPALKIWEQDEAELMASDNIFALLVLAQQYANKSKKDAEQRLRFREKLLDLALMKNIPKRRFLQALIFVKQLAALPEKLEIKYEEHYRQKRKIKKQPMFKLEDVIWLDKQVEEDTGKSLRKELADAKKEAKQAQIEKQHLIEQFVQKCFHERKWGVEEIAEFLSIEKSQVELILKKKAVKH
ncbi:MAG: hypothetical protein AAB316_03950 [Bacteroidota bacterium]